MNKKHSIDRRVDLTENRDFRGSSSIINLPINTRGVITTFRKTFNITIIDTENLDTNQLFLTGNAEERKLKKRKLIEEQFCDKVHCPRCGRVINKIQKDLHLDIDDNLCHECEMDLRRDLDISKTKKIIDFFR